MSHYKLFLLAGLVALGIALQLSGTIDIRQIINLARTYSDTWWLGLLIVVIQIMLFTFAMAGSTLVWIIAALFAPLTSTVMITTGTTLGGVLAYLFSGRLSDEWVHKVQHSRIYQYLRKQGNLFTLLALRMMPGFPHSVINYSAGILKIRMTSFITATIAGTAIKAYVYSLVIYNATTPEQAPTAMELSSIWPLLALSLLILLGMALRNHLRYK
jgi:uncharacterized membrane protein YdjX (TVP38/TMEM64 family)